MNFWSNIQISKYGTENLILMLEVMTQLEIPHGNETFEYKVKSGLRFDGFEGGSREGIVW